MQQEENAVLLSSKLTVIEIKHHGQKSFHFSSPPSYLNELQDPSLFHLLILVWNQEFREGRLLKLWLLHQKENCYPSNSSINFFATLSTWSQLCYTTLTVQVTKCCNGNENEVQLGVLLTLLTNDSNKTSVTAKVLFKCWKIDFQLHQSHNSSHTLFKPYYSSRGAFTHAWHLNAPYN